MVEVHVQLGGDTFTLHRTGSYCKGNDREVSKVQSEGYAATNNNGSGPYVWILVPDEAVGSLEWSSAGSSREIKFEDVKIGPRYNAWSNGWSK